MRGVVGLSYVGSVRVLATIPVSAMSPLGKLVTGRLVRRRIIPVVALHFIVVASLLLTMRVLAPRTKATCPLADKIEARHVRCDNRLALQSRRMMETSNTLSIFYNKQFSSVPKRSVGAIAVRTPMREYAKQR